MKTIALLVRRELKSYFDTSWGWIILTLVLVLDGLLFNAFALGSRERYSANVLSDFFYFSSGTTIGAVRHVPKKGASAGRGGRRFAPPPRPTLQGWNPNGAGTTLRRRCIHSRLDWI